MLVFYLCRFITFDCQDAADRAVSELNGTPMKPGHKIHVTYSLFEAKYV